MSFRRHGVWLVLLTAAFVGCGDGALGGFRVTKGAYHGFETVTVENSRVRVTFLAAVGGRVTEYALRKPRTNQFGLNPNFQRPENAGDDYLYGGLGDHLGLEGEVAIPARLDRAPYACEVRRSNDNVTVKLTYANPRWKLERTHVVFPDSTRLATHEVVTNLDDVPRALMPRPHPTFAVGGEADNGDYVIQPVGGATLVHRHAEPMNRNVAVPAGGSWAGVVDTKKNQAVVLVFDPRQVDTVNLWFAKEGTNVEPMRIPRLLKKGESLSMSFDMFILSAADLAKEARTLPVAKKTADEIASTLETFSKRRKEIARVASGDFYLTPLGTFRVELPKAMVMDSNPLPLKASYDFFSKMADNEPRVDAGLSLVRRGDGKTVPMPLATVLWQGGPLPSSPAKARWEFSIPVDRLEDDAYELALEVGPKRNPGRITQQIIITRGLRERIERAKSAEAGKWKPNYAAARFWVEDAGRAGASADGNIPPVKAVYEKIDKRLREARDVLAGSAPKPKTGVFPRFYWSPIDDSVQGYSVTVPDNYVESRKWPLVVHLHGRMNPFSVFEPERHDADLEELAGRRGVFLVRPHGRGNTGYRDAGADDVLSVLEQVCASYSIDRDRIYLSGQSMGGDGTLSLAMRYPGVFAAVADIFGGSDYTLWAPPREKIPEWELFRLQADSPVSAAENLLHTPVYVYHGVKDASVSVEHSRRLVRRLKELGYSHVYEEDPEGTHLRPAGLYDRVWEFLFEHTLTRDPKTVTLKTPYLRYGKGWWVQVDAFGESMKFGELRAKVEGRSIDVGTKNVTGFTLELDKDLVDPAKDITVAVDGESAFVIEKPSGRVPFHSQSDPKTVKPRWVRGEPARPTPGTLVKTSHVEGPMWDVFRSNFLLVPGTTGSDRCDNVLRAEAEWFSREQWRRVQGADCIIKPDSDLTAEDRKKANLVLIGGPEMNSVTRELAPRLPLAFEKDGSITVDGAKFPASGGAIALVYPNPDNAEHYVLLFAGTTSEATEGVIRRTGDALHEFDYAAFSERSQNADNAPLFGVFDRAWKFDKRTQWSRGGKGEPEKKSE